MAKSKTKKAKKFPKDKKGHVTVRIVVAVDCHEEVGVCVLGKHDTLEKAIESAICDVGGEIVDVHVLERTFKYPAEPKVKRAKPKAKKVATKKREQPPARKKPKATPVEPESDDEPDDEEGNED